MARIRSILMGRAPGPLSPPTIIPVLMPPALLIECFNNCAAPIFMQISGLLEQNQLLIKTPDRLLPRLLSGKLSIEHPDIQFPPGMVAEEV